MTRPCLVSMIRRGRFFPLRRGSRFADLHSAVRKPVRGNAWLAIRVVTYSCTVRSLAVCACNARPSPPPPSSWLLLSASLASACSLLLRFGLSSVSELAC